MKNALLLCTLVCSVLLHAQQSSHCTSPSIDKALRNVTEQWKDGYNNGNAAKVAALYSEDAYYLTQHFVTGIVHGRAAIQADVHVVWMPAITSTPFGRFPWIALPNLLMPSPATMLPMAARKHLV